MQLVPTLASIVLLAGLTASGLRSFEPLSGSPTPSAEAAQQTKAEGTWSEKAWLGENRTEAAVVFVNGKLYVIGGMARGMDSHTVNQEYDPAMDRWRERAPLPSPLSHPGAAALNGKIYLVGGFLRNVHLDAQDKVYEYDPSADTWRTLAPLKSPRGSVGLAAVNGKLHAIGGRDVNRVTVATHEVFDPATGKWSDLAPLPKARDHMPLVAANGLIHAIGGRFDTPNENTGMHDVYDPAKNTWTMAAPLPTPRSGGSGVLYKNMIVVSGGECDRGLPFNHHEGFDVKTGRWSTLASMPSGRHGINAATDGQVLYIPAGAPGCGTSSSGRLLTFKLP